MANDKNSKHPGNAPVKQPTRDHRTVEEIQRKHERGEPVVNSNDQVVSPRNSMPDRPPKR